MATVQPTLAVVPQSSNGIPEGQRNTTLLSRAGAMHRCGMSPRAIEAALQEENRQNCSPPLPIDEVSAIAAGIQRYPKGSASTRAVRRAAVRCLANVKAENVEWLWEPYVPLKMITILSGDPGVGKTFLSLALAASLTRGRPLVGQQEHEALGGDVSRLFLLEGTTTEAGTEGRITLADKEPLEEAIRDHRARLVIVDPLQSFLGGDVDAHRANQTRPIFDGLIRVAEKTGCAILITRHLSKGVGGTALYRGMGSIDITGAARSELFVGREPDNPSRIIMAQSKNSLAPVGCSLSYSIGEDKNIVWHGESSLGANDLLMPPPNTEERSALSEAEDFLREVLADGSRKRKEVYNQAEENGISRATLRRATKQLQVSSGPDGYGKGWVMSLPSVAQQTP